MKTQHLFISHSWTHDNHYENLTNMLDNRKYFSYKDYSVPKDDPIHTNGSDQALYKAIERKIKCCSSVVILAGVYSTHSEWINKEIEIAKKLGKPIIAVEPWGSEKTSSVVKEKADKIVRWNCDAVVDAIRNPNKGS